MNNKVHCKRSKSGMVLLMLSSNVNVRKYNGVKRINVFMNSESVCFNENIK